MKPLLEILKIDSAASTTERAPNPHPTPSCTSILRKSCDISPPPPISFTERRLCSAAHHNGGGPDKKISPGSIGHHGPRPQIFRPKASAFNRDVISVSLVVISGYVQPGRRLLGATQIVPPGGHPAAHTVKRPALRPGNGKSQAHGKGRLGLQRKPLIAEPTRFLSSNAVFSCQGHMVFNSGNAVLCITTAIPAKTPTFQKSL